MFKKIIILGLVIIMMLSFAGCEEDEIYDDKILVCVNAECKEAFLSNELSAEDFNWDNIKRIDLLVWYEEKEPEEGVIFIYLIKHGEKEVEEILQHLKTLSFVYHAEARLKGNVVGQICD